MFMHKKGFGGFRAEQKESALSKETGVYFAEKMKGQTLTRKKQERADLKLTYGKKLDHAMVIALLLIIGIAQSSRLFSLSTEIVKKVDIAIEVADIPVTEQIVRPPAPPKPSVPIPTESEEIPEDLTIALTDIDFFDIPAPPPPPDDDMEQIFVAYDEPPTIVGGFQSLTRDLKYPRIAQSAGVEGVVFIKVLVGTNGLTEKAEVMKVDPVGMGFEESALEAVQKVKWNPAKQRDRKIRVWISIPVQFRLVT